ncbi:MAG TPA: histidine--tRNA ligase [Dehalococcoidia bacterium]|nr:histidine--tRNA ligase [Dehalococcoidia bacterium]
MPDFQAPRGMNDVLPEDEAIWRHVRETTERVARLFDYRRIETPIVEELGVFTRTAGEESDIVSKEMYAFDDRGGSTLALRPEGTAGVCRAYLEHGMASRPQPVRLYYFAPTFRYDRPQAGRYRQHWQFGVECIGDPSPAADVEVLELQRTLYAELGLTDFTVRLNSIGTAETRAAYREVLMAHFAPHLETLSADSQRRYETNVMRILDSKEDANHPALQDAPSILDYLSEEDTEHFAQVRALLDGLGVEYEVDPAIVRGLDYYARTVWEFQPQDAGGQSTLGAGGRYDGLIEMLGGPSTPGTGFATGIERLVLEIEKSEPDLDDVTPDVFTVPLGDAGAIAAARLARDLRAAGVAVRAGVPGRSMRAQLRAANSSGARYAVIVGDDEAAKGVAQLKPLLDDGDQREVALVDVAGAVAD